VRRLFGVVVFSVLTMVPSFVCARTFDVMPQHADLGHQLLLQFFGETSDSRASLAAAYGDVQSESPLRGLALEVPANVVAMASNIASPPPTFSVVDPLAAEDLPSLGSSERYDAAFVPARVAQFEASSTPATAGQTDFVAAPNGGTFVSGQYRPSSGTVTLQNQSAGTGLGDTSHLAFSQPAGGSTFASSASSTTSIGPIGVHTRFDSTQVSQPQSALTDGGYGAGADLNVRALHRNLNFAVSSDYERLMRDDPSSSASFSPSTNWQLPGGDVPLVVPNYADMSRVSLGAALAVPVVNNLTLNLNVASDRMLGAYGLPGVNNLDATDNSYGGRLTFAIPHSASSLSISAQQLHYQDNLMPSDTFTQTRENVNFTVKF
jgi:hypothetical protein